MHVRRNRKFFFDLIFPMVMWTIRDAPLVSFIHSWLSLSIMGLVNIRVNGGSENFAFPFLFSSPLSLSFSLTFCLYDMKRVLIRSILRILIGFHAIWEYKVSRESYIVALRSTLISLTMITLNFPKNLRPHLGCSCIVHDRNFSLLNRPLFQRFILVWMKRLRL